jgi:hypothetical protein
MGGGVISSTGEVFSFLNLPNTHRFCLDTKDYSQIVQWWLRDIVIFFYIFHLDIFEIGTKPLFCISKDKYTIFAVAVVE